MKNIHKPYILWLGGVFNETTVANNRAVSPAANLWQEGLIRAIKDCGLSVINIGHLPEPLWPKGRFRLRDDNAMIANGIEGPVVEYYNLPMLRPKSLRHGYLKAVMRIIQRKGNPIALISYGLSYQNTALGIYCQNQLEIPWICIFAEQTGRTDSYDILKSAKGCIFLSWNSYREYPYSPKFHLDGGIDKLNFNYGINNQYAKENKVIILYTGSMARWAGVSFLIKGFKLVRNQNVELWICGRGVSEDIKRLVVLDPRVKFLGFVSKERLEEIYDVANIFVNPRPSRLPENRYNFPSKLPKYLSYGKPVISTWTDGLNPDYRDVLVTLEKEIPECLAQKIKEVLTWDDNRRKDLSLRIRKFLEFNKMWPVQAKRLLKWLEKEIFVETV